MCVSLLLDAKLFLDIGIYALFVRHEAMITNLYHAWTFTDFIYGIEDYRNTV